MIMFQLTLIPDMGGVRACVHQLPTASSPPPLHSGGFQSNIYNTDKPVNVTSLLTTNQNQDGVGPTVRWQYYQPFIPFI